MSAHEFTYAEWAALMGRGEPVSIGELILPGIDGGEYPDCDIEWHSTIAEKLQEQLVVDDNTVTIPIYLGLPAPAVDGAVIREAIRTMDDGERLDIFSEYCRCCGSNDPTCQCWNDE